MKLFCTSLEVKLLKYSSVYACNAFVCWTSEQLKSCYSILPKWTYVTYTYLLNFMKKLNWGNKTGFIVVFFPNFWSQTDTFHFVFNCCNFIVAYIEFIMFNCSICYCLRIVFSLRNFMDLKFFFCSLQLLSYSHFLKLNRWSLLVSEVSSEFTFHQKLFDFYVLFWLKQFYLVNKSFLNYYQWDLSRYLLSAEKARE